MAETVAVISSVFGCATVVVTLVSPCLRDPLSEEYKLFRKRKENLDKLKCEKDNLVQRRTEVKRQSEVKVVKKSLKVSKWLQEAQSFIEEADGWNFEGRIRKSCCGLPHYWSQYKAGKRIDEKVRQLEELQKNGEKFIDVQESDVVGQVITCTEKLVGTAASKVEEIMNCVRGKEFGAILVYGMAGSGKTQVVSHVNNQILVDYNNSNGNSEDRFDKVICVTVENDGLSESPIDNLQKKIAEKLQIDFNKAPGSRADTLADALKKKRFLIILDDMWKKLSLEEIGIPRPTKDNGCKVIIVSRSLPVGSDIKIHKKVETHLLSVTESQELFESEADIKLSQLSEDSVATAKHMIDECQGLPLAIFSLAQSLTELKMDDSGDVEAAWKEAFTKLKTPTLLESMNERAFARLKYSYDMLKKESQQCFLYCALYPSGHDIEKKELVEHWFWEGLLDSRGRRRQIEDMTQAREILDELKRAHLVQETVSQESGKECIKMRNLVRHMAVHLTKTSPHQFLIKAGEKLTYLPLQDENWSEVERASLMGNQLKALKEAPEFPKLSTLLLQKNPIFHLHDNFFSSMPNIKVLDLSHTVIHSLPKSTFSNLKKLGALLLRDCPNLKSLPSLAMSKKLLVLDLSGTPIERLPDGMKELANLIRLDLSRTNVGEFQAELVRALVCLEELLMITNSASLWGSTKGESIKELGALQRLAILHINFLDAEAFNRYVSSKLHSLSKFKFCVGGSCENKLPENSVVFIKSDFKGKPVSLPEDTSELHILRNLDLPWLQVTCCLRSLKVINISGCESLVYLFKIDMLYYLPILETISVDKCQKMEGLIEYNSGDPLQVPPHSKHLKVVHISDCENLVYLFRKEMLRYFPNLQDISIRQRQRNQVENESKEPNVFPAMDPGEQELVLVDPLKLRNMKYNGQKEEGNSQQTIWNFPELKMKIITSLLPKTSGTKKMTRNRSFESVLEAAPSAYGALSRTVSRRNDDKGLSSHSTQLITPPRHSESIIQNRKDYLQFNPDIDNIGTKISQRFLTNLYAIATFVGSAMRQKLLNPSVPNLKMLQMDHEEKTIEPSSSSPAQSS